MSRSCASLNLEIFFTRHTSTGCQTQTLVVTDRFKPAPFFFLSSKKMVTVRQLLYLLSHSVFYLSDYLTYSTPTFLNRTQMSDDYVGIIAWCCTAEVSHQLESVCKSQVSIHLIVLISYHVNSKNLPEEQSQLIYFTLKEYCSIPQVSLSGIYFNVLYLIYRSRSMKWCS